MDESVKAQLLEEFRRHLDALDTPQDEAETSEAPAPDLFTLLSELVALKNEIRIESRQVKQAMDLTREALDALQAQNDRLSQEIATQRRANERLRADAEQGLLLEVLELRDRLEAGLGSLREFQPGFMDRPRGGTARLLTGLGEGLEIGLRRLDGLLSRYGVEPLDAVGDRFDPHAMRVAAVESRADAAEGEVLEESRSGWLRGGEVLRLAEVIVNKREENS